MFGNRLTTDAKGKNRESRCATRRVKDRALRAIEKAFLLLTSTVPKCDFWVAPSLPYLEQLISMLFLRYSSALFGYFGVLLDPAILDLPQ